MIPTVTPISTTVGLLEIHSQMLPLSSDLEHQNIVLRVTFRIRRPSGMGGSLIQNKPQNVGKLSKGHGLGLEPLRKPWTFLEMVVFG